MGHPPRIPVWLRPDQSVVYFVTICVEHRKPVLANAAAFVAFTNAALKLRDWTILAGILMPDHLHFLAAPQHDREAKVGNVSGAIKRWMRQELDASWKWQPGSFDRLVRSDESLHEKWITWKRTRSARVWSEVGKIGRTVTRSPNPDCRATAPVATP
jgi:REP element-mobilizing transposase RayT